MERQDPDRGPQGGFMEQVIETIGGCKTGVDDDSVFDLTDEAGAVGREAGAGSTSARDTNMEEGDIDASAG